MKTGFRCRTRSRTCCHHLQELGSLAFYRCCLYHSRLYEGEQHLPQSSEPKTYAQQSYINKHSFLILVSPIVPAYYKEHPVKLLIVSSRHCPKRASHERIQKKIEAKFDTVRSDSTKWTVITSYIKDRLTNRRYQIKNDVSML